MYVTLELYCTYTYMHSYTIYYPLQVLCLGVLVASAVTLSTIGEWNFISDDIPDDIPVDDIIPDDSSARKDRDRYRSVAVGILSVSIAGIISQVIMLIIHALYYFEIIKCRFCIFTVIVSYNNGIKG